MISSIPRRLFLLLPAIVAAVLVPLPEAQAAKQAAFDPRVITFGAEREQIRNTPIEQRPYRPLHIYGNSVRRRSSRR